MCYGRSDVTLASTWPEEFDAVVGKLAPIGLRAPQLYSSPLSRCAALACHLAGRGLPKPIHDARLQEMDFGRWELTPWADLPSRELAAWRKDVTRARAPEGESFGEVADRTARFFEEARASIGPGGAVIVCHGGVIRALLAHVIGCSLEQALKLQVDYGGVTRLELGEHHHRVRYVNR